MQDCETEFERLLSEHSKPLLLKKLGFPFPDNFGNIFCLCLFRVYGFDFGGQLWFSPWFIRFDSGFGNHSSG